MKFKLIENLNSTIANAYKAYDELKGRKIREDYNTNYDFEDLFWWITGNEDPLNLRVRFDKTNELIDEKYADIIWSDPEADGDLSNLSDEAKQEIIDSARQEALSWRNYDIYNMGARYVDSLTLYKGLKQLLGVECNKLTESLDLDEALGLKEDKQPKTCIICKKEYTGYGNNAEPVAKGQCCDDWNRKVVIPARLKGLKEDTIKQNGKWVNKGKEGTHGTFKTKKAADQQRKAMFARGYSEDVNESLHNDEISDFFDKAKRLGVKTLADLKRLMQNEPETATGSDIEKMRKYSKAANPENKMLSNESLKESVDSSKVKVIVTFGDNDNPEYKHTAVKEVNWHDWMIYKDDMNHTTEREYDIAYDNICNAMEAGENLPSNWYFEKHPEEYYGESMVEDLIHEELTETEELKEIEVPNYFDTWSSFDSIKINDKTYYIMENDEWGDETFYLVITPDFEEIYETFDDIKTCLRDEGILTDELEEKLIQGKSDATLKKNIATEIEAGKDPKQAYAIAKSIQKKNMKEDFDEFDEFRDMNTMLDEWAKEDAKRGLPINDFNEFEKAAEEVGVKVSEDDFNTYLDYYEERKHYYNDLDSDELDSDAEETEIDSLYHDASEDELRKMGAFDNLNDNDEPYVDYDDEDSDFNEELKKASPEKKKEIETEINQVEKEIDRADDHNNPQGVIDGQEKLDKLQENTEEEPVVDYVNENLTDKPQQSKDVDLDGIKG